MPSTELCPCGSGVVHAACCGPCFAGTPAATALALMRSRYTAYALKNIDYILATSDPATLSTVDREATRAWAEESIWVGLTIVETEAGGVDDDAGVVEFIARHTFRGEARAHHERGRFRKENGRWLYVDAVPRKTLPFRAAGPKPERNAPCACGSGKKYKRCCGLSN